MNSVAKHTVIPFQEFRAGEFGRQVSNAVSAIADQVAGAAKSTDGFVRSSPWRAIGVVALAGLATGWAVSHGARRLRKHRDDARSRPRHEEFTSEVSGG